MKRGSHGTGTATVGGMRRIEPKSEIEEPSKINPLDLNIENDFLQVPAISGSKRVRDEESLPVSVNAPINGIDIARKGPKKVVGTEGNETILEKVKIS